MIIVGDEEGNSVGCADGWTDGTAVDSSVAGEFEGFSVNGKTFEAGDGFSDGNPLGSTDNDPVREVEGITVCVIIVGDENVISVGWADG